MSLKILTEPRDNPLRIRDLINLSPALFLEYLNAFAVFSAYIASKYPSNFSLIPIDHIIRIIDL